MGRYFVSWKENASSKYYSTIDRVIKRGGTDLDAQRAIQENWFKEGRESTSAGSLLHSAIELKLNGTVPPPSDDLSKWERWWNASEFSQSAQLVTQWRTALTIC